MKKRNVLCPDCGSTREVFAAEDVLRCRSCTDIQRRAGKLLTCPGCKTEFYVSDVEVRRNRKYCSDACRLAGPPPPHDPAKTKARDDAMAVARKGEGNPNWKHGKRAGKDHYRREGFNLANKDEESCRNCGAKAVHIHHIVPRSKSRLGKTDLRNGMPLCFGCHRGWHDRRVVIWRDRLAADEEAFVLELAGEWWVDKNYPRRPDEDLRRMYAELNGHDPEEQWRFCKEGAEGGPGAVRMAQECADHIESSIPAGMTVGEYRRSR